MNIRNSKGSMMRKYRHCRKYNKDMNINSCLAANCCNGKIKNAIKTRKNKFLWGASTSAFQVEGTSNSYGRGLTIWDIFVDISGNIIDGMNANIACNSYLQYKDDIQALKLMGANAYRFSIAWSRIFPNGKGQINQAGVDYYNNVINSCLENGITPLITLYHWDLPQALQESYNGWLCTNGEIWTDFRNYADFCFKIYGDRVKHWITINEPQTICVNSYEYNYFAPGTGTSNGNSPNGDEYKVGHNLLIAHGYAADLYRKKYQNKQNGKIGIACNMDWGEPLTNSQADVDAAERRNKFWGCWFWGVIYNGNYPSIMIELVGDRLPKFTEEQSNLIQGSIDYMYLNSYSAEYIYDQVSKMEGWTYDQQTNQTYTSTDGVLIGAPTQSDWLHIVPWGIKNVIVWLQEQFSFNGPGTGFGIRDKNGKKRKIPLIITENGMDILNQTNTTSYEEAYDDTQRISYYSSYLENISEAIKISGVNMQGYCPWSLMDNFEWNSAYTCRFGIFYVDCNSSYNIPRLPKKSAYWFNSYIQNNPNGPS